MWPFSKKPDEGPTASPSDPRLVGDALVWNSVRFRLDHEFWLTAVDDSLGVWRLEETRPGSWGELIALDGTGKDEEKLAQLLRTSFRLVPASSPRTSPPRVPPEPAEELRRELGKAADERAEWATAVLKVVEEHQACGRSAANG